MLANSARLAMAVASASFIALASHPARACSAISDAALAIVASGTSVSYGAPFFTQSQKNAFGYTNGDMTTLWGTSSPTSSIYYSDVLAAHYFTQISTIGGFAAGDALVINATSTYGGHTAVITGAATQISPQISPVYSGTQQWAVPIADSTSTSHGCNANYPDSRWTGTCATGTFTAGVGTAYMRLYTDLSGNLLGYTWSVTSGATYYSPSTRPYAVGRLTPCPPL